MTIRALIMLGLVIGEVVAFVKLSRQGKRIAELEGEEGKGEKE